MKNRLKIWFQNSALEDFKGSRRYLVLGMCILYFIILIPSFILQVVAWLCIHTAVDFYNKYGERIYQALLTIKIKKND